MTTILKIMLLTGPKVITYSGAAELRKCKEPHTALYRLPES